MFIHTTFLGGGFGRAGTDFVMEAVEISKAVGAPVKLTWSREDDMQHDFYRPASYARLAGALDADGWPVAWTNRIACPSIMEAWFPGSTKNNLDPTSVEGVANLPYSIPNILVDYVRTETGIPVGFWRSVGASQNGFFSESFMDELAAAGKKDPYEFRRRLLDKAPRHLGVLELAAQKAGWDKPLPAGRFRGIAVLDAFREFRRAGGRNFGGPQGANAESASRGLRGGCGPRGESSHHRDAKRERHRVRLSRRCTGRSLSRAAASSRPTSTIIRCCAWMRCPHRNVHHAQRGPTGAGELPCLPWSRRCATRSSPPPENASAVCRSARRIWRSAFSGFRQIGEFQRSLWSVGGRDFSPDVQCFCFVGFSP